MVMRNQQGGGNSPGWWDDLPPKVRERFGGERAASPVNDTLPLTPLPAARPQPAPAPTARVTRELSRLAVLFLGVAVANMVVLLLALAILRGGPDLPAIPLLDPAP